VRVPDDVVAPSRCTQARLVLMTVDGHNLRSSVVHDGGVLLLGVSPRNPAPGGLAADDVLGIDLELAAAAGEVTTLRGLLADLLRAPGARPAFNALPCSGRQGTVMSVEGARTEQARRRRIGCRVAWARQVSLASTPRTAPFRRES